VSVVLRPLLADELDRYAEQGIESYARQMIDHAGYPKATAVGKSRADHDMLLASNATFFAVERDGEQVGYLVLGERESHGRRAAFVYDVTIAPEHRGAGLGRQAMQLAEEEARARGHALMELNVFGGNEVARRLYASLGYRETAVTMTKDLQ
jgi:ribosomal protein S18 acetylase RimI-like enzyme